MISPAHFDREHVMDFVWFLLGCVAVGIALTYIKLSSPNPTPHHDAH